MASLRRAKMDVIHEYCLLALEISSKAVRESDERMQEYPSASNVSDYHLDLAENSALLGLRELTTSNGGSNEFLMSSSDVYLLMEYDLSKAWL